MQRINKIVKMMLLIDRNISVSEVAKVINGKSIHVDLMA